MIKNSWLILGTTLLLLTCIEIGLQVAFRIQDHSAEKPQNDRREIADTYANASWTHGYFREFEESSAAEWQPYTYWRRKPYTGKYININDDGLRKVPENTSSTLKNKEKLRVFVFGGSTVWGTGVRDEFTIPALIKKSIEKSFDIPIEVSNFGQSGYVSTQGLIELIRQIQSGNIPDVVVFYDGVNDTYSAYQQGIAGWPQNEYHRKNEFNLSKNKKDLVKQATQGVFDRLSLVRFAKYLAGTIPSSPTVNPPKELLDMELVIEKTIEIYKHNMSIVAALSKAYDFEYAFYWQPTIFQKKFLTTYEQEELERQRHAMRFHLAVYDRINKSTEQIKENYNFFSLSHIFSKIRDPIYIDYCHLGEAGNIQITKQILKTLGPMF